MILAVVMGEASDLEDVLVAGMVESARWLRDHEALTYLLEHEPGTVLPYVTFGGFDQVMRVASDLAAPFFARWLEPEQASRAAEWAVRSRSRTLSTAEQAELDRWLEANPRHRGAYFLGLESKRGDAPYTWRRFH